jgi:hypothetical protein
MIDHELEYDLLHPMHMLHPEESSTVVALTKSTTTTSLAEYTI